ncbi:hypothetical protein V2J23_12485 [Geobacillus thermoleovorans]
MRTLEIHDEPLIQALVEQIESLAGDKADIPSEAVCFIVFLAPLEGW